MESGDINCNVQCSKVTLAATRLGCIDTGVDMFELECTCSSLIYQSSIASVFPLASLNIFLQFSYVNILYLMNLLLVSLLYLLFISVLKLICKFSVYLYPNEEVGCSWYMNNLKIIFLWMTVE